MPDTQNEDDKMDGAPDTIYHYCGIDSFNAILENKSIRLGNMN